MRKIRKRKHVDIVAAKELYLYTENDADIYRQRLEPITKNMAKKKYRGIYNRKLAIKGFQHATDAAAQKYTKEFGSRNGFGIFSPIERKYAAAKLTMAFEDEFNLGNYSHYKQKYLQKKRRGK